MEILIVTEKPEISRVLPKAFDGKFTERNGALIGMHGMYNITVIATDGHILRLQQPQEIRPELKWHTPQFLLPLPDRPGLLPQEGKSKITRKLRDIGRRVQEVIICTDPDLEGDLIGQDVANYCGFHSKSTRMLLSKSLEPKDVLVAFESRKPIVNYLPRYRAGQYKRESDWYWMYLVRAHTFAARNGLAGPELALSRDDKRVLSCGRVQGIILRLVCEWHLERRAHIPEEHYKLKAITDVGTMAYVPPTPDAGDERVQVASSGQIQIRDLEKIRGVASQLKGLDSLIVANVFTKRISENPPPPFDSSSLMQAMSKQYKWTMKKTAAIADKVRFKGLITYVRTDDARLPVNYLEPEFMKPVLDACNFVPGLNDHIEGLNTNIFKTGYECLHVTADELDHQGIAPSDKNYLDADLTSDEFLLYEMVVRRFVMAMMPKSIKRTTWVRAQADVTGVLDENPITFVASQTELEESGWRSMKSGGSESPPLDFIPDKGERLGVEMFELSEDHTKPKNPMTVNDLLQQLKSPSMLADNETQLKAIRECRGIGTAATRSGTFEKTKKRGYMAEDGNTRISPMKWGIDYLNYLHPDLVSIGLTEDVENAIKVIEAARSDNDAVHLRDSKLAKARAFITKHINIALESL